MAKHWYRVEVLWERSDGNRWVSVVDDCSRQFGEGFLESAARTPGPRLAHRLVRDDGKVVDEEGGTTRAGIGMVAGFPTAEQYEAAAARCIECAKRIREREAAKP